MSFAKVRAVSLVLNDIFYRLSEFTFLSTFSSTTTNLQNYLCCQQLCSAITYLLFFLVCWYFPTFPSFSSLSTSHTLLLFSTLLPLSPLTYFSLTNSLTVSLSFSPIWWSNSFNYCISFFFSYLMIQLVQLLSLFFFSYLMIQLIKLLSLFLFLLSDDPTHSITVSLSLSPIWLSKVVPFMTPQGDPRVTTFTFCGTLGEWRFQ